MASISFRIVPHSRIPGRQVVEILAGGTFVGAIYPDDKNQGVKIVSAHMAHEIEPGFEGNVVHDNGESTPPIPALLVKFRPNSYVITPRGIVRHS